MRALSHNLIISAVLIVQTVALASLVWFDSGAPETQSTLSQSSVPTEYAAMLANLSDAIDALRVEGRRADEARAVTASNDPDTVSELQLAVREVIRQELAHYYDAATPVDDKSHVPSVGGSPDLPQWTEPSVDPAVSAENFAAAEEVIDAAVVTGTWTLEDGRALSQAAIRSGLTRVPT